VAVVNDWESKILVFLPLGGGGPTQWLVVRPEPLCDVPGGEFDGTDDSNDVLIPGEESPTAMAMVFKQSVNAIRRRVRCGNSLYQECDQTVTYIPIEFLKFLLIRSMEIDYIVLIAKTPSHGERPRHHDQLVTFCKQVETYLEPKYELLMGWSPVPMTPSSGWRSVGSLEGALCEGGGGAASASSSDMLKLRYWGGMVVGCLYIVIDRLDSQYVSCGSLVQSRDATYTLS
jgi:hypothetical protein